MVTVEEIGLGGHSQKTARFEGESLDGLFDYSGINSTR